ncbi:MAG: hypothetical protein RIQ38_2900 [Pseudomonadota bacterium]|jgi:galactonate dehydratase
MSQTPVIEQVQAMVVSLPRETPYLGPLGPQDRVTEQGYILRHGNRAIYPSRDSSVLVRITDSEGRVGWGETYGIIAPFVTARLIDEVMGPYLIGRDALDVTVLQEDLYDQMRIRGHFGGYWTDAAAALDIGLWDLAGKRLGVPLVKLLGGQRQTRLPAYVSGLPGATLADRVALAQRFAAQGFRAFKFHAVVSFDGIVQEMRALREALGPDVELMVDLHWKFTAHEALQLIERLEPWRPMLVEAPCAPEDLEGQRQVAQASRVPIALGEELATVFEMRPRMEQRAMSIVQPEMGHTGVSQFMQIGRMAHAFHMRMMPHASIGMGIYQAASLHAAAALPNVPWHEYQHSVLDRNLGHMRTQMRCQGGYFELPQGPGLGIEPDESLWEFLQSP